MEQSPPVLEIRLLGSPTVSWQGAPVSIVRRQTRILLYRLAAPGPTLSRDHLSFLFWPDVPESIAGRNLSHLLTHLRQGLPDSDILITTDDQVSLDPQRIWIDVNEFLHLRDIRGAHRDTGRLVRSVELYGGPFLDGVSAPQSPDYESWMMAERRTLERRYRDTLVALVGEFTNTGAYDQAIRFAHRYLATDRLDESMHQRLIALYVARGDRAAAVQQYQLCAALLERELGVLPLPETLALYDSMLSGKPSLPQTSSPPAHWTTLPGPNVPLIGRMEAWETLERLYLRAAGGRGSVALITGEGGIGKSRLLEEFVSHSSSRAFVASGQPGAQSIPFHVVVQAIRPHLRIDELSGRVLNDRLRLVPSVWLAEAARLLPELCGDERVAGLPQLHTFGSGASRPQSYECLSRLVQAMATNERPALLCLDNIQWADTESLQWLAYFALRLQEMPLLVLLAFGSDEGTQIDGLRQDLLRLGLLTEVTLEGLTEAEVQEMLNHLVGAGSQDERLVARLHAATGGNPYSAIQIVSALQESRLPRAQWADLPELPAPLTLCAAVGAKLAALDPVARQVIEACAILSPSLNFDLIRLTSGRRELETLDSLEILVERGLLSCHGTTYQFHQDVVRRVLEDRMSPMRRQLLHRRAGRALEQINRHAVEALAHHFEAGDEPAKAAHYYELAAQRAEALVAWQAAENPRIGQRELQPQ